MSNTNVTVSPLAGKPAPKQMLVDLARLERDYYERRPDLDDRNQWVSFGTSGHRGSSLHGTFTETHILAISQAICDYRRHQGIEGPLFMGKDSHAAPVPCIGKKLDCQRKPQVIRFGRLHVYKSHILASTLGLAQNNGHEPTQPTP